MIGSLLIGAGALRATDANIIDIHGAVSATETSSQHYNYLGSTENTLSLNNVELTLNGSHRFSNGIRASAQVYAFKLGDYNSVMLDYASLEYSFSEYIGVRVGRYKSSFGLYGDSQDVDAVRPFIYLPSGMYGKASRATDVAADGAAIYGTLPLKAAGNLSYQAAYGQMLKINKDDLMIKDGVGLMSVTSSDPGKVSNGALNWETPVEGLRAVATYWGLKDLKFNGPVMTSAALALAPNDGRLAPLAFPAGAWDYMLAGRNVTTTVDMSQTTYSLEYTKGNWQFASEYFLTHIKSTTTYPVLGIVNANQTGDAWDVMATYQLNKKWQLGAYYTETYGNKNDRKGNTIKSVAKGTAYLKDAALAVCYSITNNWNVKAEVHELNGLYGLTASLNGDAAKWNNNNWSYLALKSTITF